jgi:crotonobetainyl-CoA:carnitine CoA-transferase CaiB-like acyl-CoA transferase
MVPHGVFPCDGDDRWIALAVRNDREWKTFCHVMGKLHWSDEPLFASFAARKQNEDELEGLIGEWTRNYTPKTLMEMMQEAGIPAGVVATPEDLFSDPQLNHRRHFRFLDHGVMGKPAHHAPAYILSETPNHIHKAGPCLGEDNEHVYKEILGYSDEEIAEFLFEGVITTEYDDPDIMRQ